MPVLVKVIDFRLNESGAYQARVGGITITASLRGEENWGLSVDEYETLTVPPCHDEYFDSPTCEAGKDLDDVEDLDTCELTCPSMRQVESLKHSSFLFGATLEEMVPGARSELQCVGYDDEPSFMQVDAKPFLESKWRIGGELY